MTQFPPSPHSLRLLTAVSKVFEKYPTNERAVLLACQALPLCKQYLPEQPPPILTDLQRHAFSSFSTVALKNSTALLNATFNLAVTLWMSYPRHLPGSCDMEQLAGLLNAALDTNTHHDRKAAIKVGRDLVGCFMRVLNDQQLKTLEREGVYDKLRSLVTFYDEMTPEDLQQIVVGVGMFAELKPNPQAFLAENIHCSLLFAAEKFHSHLVLQQLIWRLLSLHCQKSQEFARKLLSEDVLSAVVTVIREEGSHLAPILRFLTVCCHIVPKPSIQQCLEKEELIALLVGVIETEGPAHKMEDIINTCDFLAFLCSKCGTIAIKQALELQLVLKLEKAARKWPDSCILPACIAIEGVVNAFPPDPSRLPPFVHVSGDALESLTQLKAEFYMQDHHVFIREMLTDPVVYMNVTLLELVYVTFQKILKQSTPDALAKTFSRDFIEFYVISFIRDAITFPNDANRISFTAHFFVFLMKTKEPLEYLRELDFHTAVADLLQCTTSYEVTLSSLGLLACLIGKYYDHLKDVKPFLKTQTPSALISKAKQYGKIKSSHFGDDFGRSLLNLTADKELSLELYDMGFMEDLVELVEDEYTPVIVRCTIHAIGNIALGGQHIKQILLDRKMYETFLRILSHETKRGDPFLLSACCRVLHILASGDWAKRKFVECGCVEVLLKLIRVRQDNAEVRWRPLGLLSSLGFMSVMNRRYVLTRDIVEAVVEILKESSHGKVVSYTMLIFLASGELDDGSMQLRELDVGEALKKAVESPKFKKESPDLDRWGTHVLEKLHLHTISVPPGALPPPPPSCSLVSNWPPQTPEHESFMEVEEINSPTSSPPIPTTRKLLSQDDAFLRPYFPVASELSSSAKEQLESLGLDPNEPLFRIGRVFGSTHGLCSNCEKDGVSEELVIRAQSMTPAQYQLLIDRGWYRRGGIKMFRLRYNHNVSCCDWETKVSVKDFDHTKHKSYKKVLRRMPLGRLSVETRPSHFSREAFDLYNEYHVQKHDKPRKSEYSYCEHIVNSPIAQQTVGGVDYGTFHQLYRLDGKLVAIGVMDIVPKGLVSIYMWYNVTKEISKYSFGVYSALKEIELVRELSLRNPEMQYYYLQGWNGGNKKLSYKANYEPEEFYCPCITEGWVASLTEVDAHRDAYIRRKREKEGGEKSGEQCANDLASAGPPSLQEEEKKDGKKTEDQTKAEEASDSGGSVNNPAGEKGAESTDGATSVSKQANEVADSRNDVSAKTSTSKDGNEGNKPSEPYVPCEAYPNDLVQYREASGGAPPDASKIVVCLNYTEYMFLEEMFARFPVSREQRELMERRFCEILVAVGPELASQLVVDIKGCVSSHRPTLEPASNSSPLATDPVS